MPLVRTIVSVMLFLTCLCANSRALDFSHEIELGTAYIDNIDLTDQNSRSGFVSQLNPQIGIIINSHRIQGTVNYELQNVMYHDDSQSDKSYHQFDAQVTTSLIPNSLHVNTIANYNQQTISFDNPSGNSNLTGTDNISDRATFGLQPTWLTRLPKGLTAELSGSYYLTSTQIDSTSIYHSLVISPLHNKTPLDWQFSVQQNQVKFDNNQERLTNIFGANFSYPVAQFLSMTSRIGYEEDKTDNQSATLKNSDAFFSIGLRWFPKGVLNLSLNYEDHYYGDFLSINASYQKQRFLFTLSYDQEITTDREQDLRNIGSTTNTPIAPTENDSSDIFLQETTAATVDYSYPRGTITIQARYDQQTTESDFALLQLTDEDITEFQVSWDHQLTRRYSIVNRLRQRDRDVSGGRQNQDLYLSSRLNYEVNPSVSASLYINKNHRKSNVANDEYRSTITGFEINIRI